MIVQCKGKDISNIASSKLLSGVYYGSIKYDGHYGQIHKHRDRVIFYTSGGKHFYLPTLEKELLQAYGDISFVLEFEYSKLGKGKLGDRVTNGKLTTYRVNTANGISNAAIEGEEIFRIFDIISYGQSPIITPFATRLETLRFISNRFPSRLQLVDFTLGSLPEFTERAKSLIKEGYEGMYLKHSTHTYIPGKRVNTAIKLKYRPTADLVCIGIEEGEGKYVGMIGALILKDSKGRVVKVGSGLDDYSRAKEYSYFIDKVIEIEYEQILDTYIQPAFVCIREDKNNIN